MERLIELDLNTWDPLLSSEAQLKAISDLEAGSVLFMPQLPFKLLSSEQRFLSPLCADGHAKNISLKPGNRVLRGSACLGQDYDDLMQMLLRFSKQAHLLVTHLFPRYISALQLARTSYRPIEIAGRVSSYRKDDTRLHVDAFPATPNQGRRILRVFSNIHPQTQPRVWRLGEPFQEVVRQFLPKTSLPFPGITRLLQLLKLTKGRRTLYDHLMLQIHDQMKADLNYQSHAEQLSVNFMPQTTWIVQTDQVSHAAMSGQYLLEQTFYLPIDAMLHPECSPLRILEQSMNRTLV